MRKILIILGIALAVLLAVAAYLVMNIDSVVHSRIERTGSRIAGVPVTVGSVEISLARGSATITDLAMANPPGFSEHPAIAFDEIRASIRLNGDVTLVHAGGPSIRVEGSAQRTNIDVLRGNVAPAEESAGGAQTETGGADAGGGQAGGSGGESGAEAGEDEPSRNYVIERIEIVNASAHIDLDELDQPQDLVLDELVFTNLSGSRSDITRQLLRQLTAAINQAVRGRLREAAAEAVRAELNERSGELKERARNELKKLFD